MIKEVRTMADATKSAGELMQAVMADLEPLSEDQGQQLRNEMQSATRMAFADAAVQIEKQRAEILAAVNSMHR
jgi:hypothetical protein